MIKVREATERDIPEIREIFLSVYGKDYPHREVYDEQWLKRSVFSDDALMLVAEDGKSGKVVGTGSVLLDYGAHSDLVGEFGRLAVHPEYRRAGIGKLLMQRRIEAVEDRLHIGIVVGRAVHPYAQRISLKHHFYPVGFLPLRHLFARRESFALMARCFGHALALRGNNPRVIPEVYPLAHRVLAGAGMSPDLIVDEESAPYPSGGPFRIQELSVRGFPALLRIERGRVRHREVFGSMRLEYGFFRLKARRASYFLALEKDRVIGAIGFIEEPHEHTVQVFELIALDDQVIRFLLSEFERRCREDRKVEYIEIDVSAHAPRMQRTLLELNFMPAAYIPAMVFHEVERLDIIKMVRLVKMQDLGELGLTRPVRELADLVMRGFTTRAIVPRMAQAVTEIPLFKGLDEEQVLRLAGVCSVQEHKAGERIFSEAEPAHSMYLVLEGKIGISAGKPSVGIGTVGKGEAFGELSLLAQRPHSATATAETRVEVAALAHKDLADLVRRRPDIGVVIYKNLATGLGAKLLRSDSSLRDRVLGESELLNLTMHLTRREQ